MSIVRRAEISHRDLIDAARQYVWERDGEERTPSPEEAAATKRILKAGGVHVLPLPVPASEYGEELPG